MNVSLSNEALQDLMAAADWLIDAQAWPAVDALHNEVRKTSQRLSRTPGLGTQGPKEHACCQPTLTTVVKPRKIAT